MKINEQISEIITQFTNKKVMSLRQFAKLIGVHAATVSRMKNRTYNPGLDVINRIADLFGLELVLVSKEHADMVREKYCNIKDAKDLVCQIKRVQIEKLKAQIKELEEETE